MFRFVCFAIISLNCFSMNSFWMAKLSIGFSIWPLRRIDSIKVFHPNWKIKTKLFQSFNLILKRCNFRLGINWINSKEYRNELFKLFKRSQNLAKMKLFKIMKTKFLFLVKMFSVNWEKSFNYLIDNSVSFRDELFLDLFELFKKHSTIINEGTSRAMSYFRILLHFPIIFAHHFWLMLL